MKKLLTFIFGAIILLSLVEKVFSSEKTSTGFYWPTGSADIGSSGPWLGSGCSGGDGKYYDGLYHTGRDMTANLNDPVYAIAEGDVAYISNSPQSGWGDGNAGVFLRHKKADGKYFWALYGHIVTSVSVGQHISAGQDIDGTLSCRGARIGAHTRRRLRHTTRVSARGLMTAGLGEWGFEE